MVSLSAPITSVPPTRIEPDSRVECGLCRPSTAIDDTDLPEPDSPTMPEGLAAADRVAEVGDGLDQAVVGRELDGEVLDDQVGVCVAGRRPNSIGPELVSVVMPAAPAGR